MIKVEKKIRKTTHKFNWDKGFYIERILTRSFNTLQEAEAFAEGKDVIDIFRNKDRFTVEWKKTIDNND